MLMVDPLKLAVRGYAVARVKVSMMSIGAPQCLHTKVGLTEPAAAGAALRYRWQR
jgi:hypothetical protein